MILIIFCHPSRQSHNGRILERVEKVLKKKIRPTKSWISIKNTSKASSARQNTLAYKIASVNGSQMSYTTKSSSKKPHT